MLARAVVVVTLLCSLVVAWAGPGECQPVCTPLASPSQESVVEVTPAEAASLAAIVAAAASGTTIVLHDGFYDLSAGDYASRLTFDSPGVTLRSASGRAEQVVLDGGYVTGELVSIRASNVTIADLTLKRAYYHPIHVSGRSGSPISGTLIHNLHIVDPGEQAIKINPVEDGWADDGIIECSHIELTATGRSQIRNSCYTGGIDAHAARGWIVRRNRIEGFWCANGLSEHAIHFWRAARDTLVEQNVILDSARGIGLGLGPLGGSRLYPDDPYPQVPDKGHIDGVVRNNFIAASDANLFASEFGFDTGIGLEQATGARVLHNSVAATQTPASSSIEWRFTGTVAEVSNNLATHSLKPRDDALAILQGNLSGVPTTWFVDVPAGDLHLAAAGAAAVDAGTPLSAASANDDIDREWRDSHPDVGADERFAALFRDGFESGDLSAWNVSG